MNKLITLILLVLFQPTVRCQTISTPKLNWAKMSSLYHTRIYAMAVGKDNNVYVTGITSINSNLATSGAHQELPGGGGDAFISKIDKHGNIIWATYYGGTGGEVAYDIVLHGNDDVYVTGYTQSLNNIATAGSHQDKKSGGYDGFLVKLDSSGKRIWGTYFGKTGKDFGIKLGVTKNDYIILAGTTNSTSGISMPGAYQLNYGGGGDDAFIARFDTAGGLIETTYFGGEQEERVNSLVIDTFDNIYLAGSTTSKTGLATSGFQMVPGAYFDGYIAKFSSVSNIAWATYYGGDWNDYGYGAAVDKAGNIYLAGCTGSNNSIATPGSHKPTGMSGYDAYIAKFNTNGNRLWGTYYGGYWHEQIHDIIVDDNDNVFVTGYTDSDTGIATPDALQPVFGSVVDLFLAKFDEGGFLKYGTYYEARTSARDHGNALAVDRLGNLYVCGENDSSQTNYILMKFCVLSGLITTQPSDTVTQVGGNAMFTVKVAASDLIYQWQTNTGAGYYDITNGGAFSGATTATLLFNNTMLSDSGRTFRCVISNGNCTDTTNEATLKVSMLSVAETSKDKIIVYPNPASNRLIIQSGERIEKIDIVNVHGQTLYSADVSGYDFDVDINSFPSGLYLIIVNNIYIKRIVKE